MHERLTAVSEGQYFESVPSVESAPKPVEVLLPDISFQLETDRGTFSYGRLDTGTRLLLLEAPPPPETGNLLDLGCGSGALSIALGLRSPRATVWAVDVNERALSLVRSNAIANRAGNVRAVRPHDVPDDLTFDVIWSNPPIRIGKAALHDLLERWLTRLSVAASAILVVQRHLGADSLASWLRSQRYTVDRLSSRAGYRLLRVTRSESPPDPASPQRSS
jgi:16S rRNA G1207 methylase RsmC